MRRLMIVAALAAAGLGAAAACADNSPQPPATSAPPPASSAPPAAADETKQVCTEAMAEATAASTEITAKVDQLVQAAQSGDLGKAAQLQTELRQRASDMQTKVNGWSSKNIKPEVKAVLTEAGTTIQQAVSGTPDATTKSKFQEIGVKLATACAGA
jgi:hypothetical protein